MAHARALPTAPTTGCTAMMTGFDRPHATRRRAVWAAASLCLGIASACSAATVPADTMMTKVAGQAAARRSGVPAPAPTNAGHRVASRVIGTTDRRLGDGGVCVVNFVYAGRAPESIFWEEPCAGVTARMMGRGELERLGRWARLDAVERSFVAGMPGGKVLYVEGGASASIYPIGTGGTTYEVSVAD
ncbi:hypothetical protein [Sphingomonas endolithica]|uniref:hypothetical protein n=1 Tax=Sphingomonas endolithica TaxID=2972485 RepID=UPI0021AE4FDC|nr:hypothetical protein [Sphingomonas sp. ZFBP2030]